MYFRFPSNEGKGTCFPFIYLLSFRPHYRVISFFFFPSFLSFFYRISLKIEISPRYIKFYRNYFHSAKASSFSSRDTGIFIVNFNIPLMERVIRFRFPRIRRKGTFIIIIIIIFLFLMLLVKCRFRGI